jgi:hypothetical protein
MATEVHVSNEEVAAEIDAAVRAAGQQFQNHHVGAASGGLLDAIELALTFEGEKLRGRELAKLGRLCLQARLEDLALFALVEACAAFEAAAEYPVAETLMIEVAATFAQLGNLDAAAHWNQRALELSLAHEDFANAASASTNLAAFHGQLHESRRAYELATLSLAYLEREAHPRTETMTRALLTMLADRLELPAEGAFALARPLFGALDVAKVNPGLREIAVTALERIAGRHLAAHGDLDPETWKRQHLPELWRADA